MKARPGSILIACGVLVLAVAGCEEWADRSRYNAPEDHTVSKKKAMHLPGLNDPGIYCIECHGSDLAGGTTGVSCFECHGRKWSGTGASADIHTILRGEIMHGSGLFSPLSSCSRCHGSDLSGGTVGVSCYKCHGELWLTGGAGHTVSQDGIMHAPGLNNPASNCSSCHGSDLRGGTAGVSCYKCHGAEWQDSEEDD